MEGQTISERLKNTASGLKRFARTIEYLPESINSQIELIQALCNDIENQIEELKIKKEEEIKIGYNRGFEAGKEDAINQFQALLSKLENKISDIKTEENEKIKYYFRKFIIGLTKIISQKDIRVLEGYINGLIKKIENEKARIFVSEKIYSELNAKIFLPENIQLCADENLNPEQIFLERDNILCDVGLDRFIEEIELD